MRLSLQMLRTRHADCKDMRRWARMRVSGAPLMWMVEEVMEEGVGQRVGQRCGRSETHQ